MANTLMDWYTAANPTSAELYRRALAVIPGGVTRTGNGYNPFPLYLVRGEGCYVYDADGHRYVDFTNNASALVLGHAHPEVTRQVQARVSQGSAFLAPGEEEVHLAEELCHRVPSLEQVRFANSGSEGVMYALRLAAAYTGRGKIAKLEGAYHGTHDRVQISTLGAFAGDRTTPQPAAAARGLLPATSENVVVLPWENAAAEAMVRRHAGELACVILEPVVGGAGFTPLPDGFLQRMRAVTRDLGILLIFDEVITLRLAPGGAQERYGVVPDLTAMGKMIGGGYPVGGFGGRREIMRVLDPAAGAPAFLQPGTFNGNVVTMTAGLATLRELTPERIARINSLGDDLRRRLSSLAQRLEVPVQVTGDGSLFGLHFRPDPVISARTSADTVPELARHTFFSLLQAGLYLGAGMKCNLSAAVPDEAVEELAATLETIWLNWRG